MKTINFLSLLLVCSIFFACSDDDVAAINEEELITTVELTLINTNDMMNVVVYRFADNDGDGPNAPVLSSTGNLMSNSSYTGSVQFLNESISPSEDITAEVIEEADEHEVFYISSIADMAIVKDDVDNNNNPLGIMTSVQTGAVSTGTLTVVLRHEPMKPNDGTLLSAGGETDVEVVFDLAIQ